MATHPKTLQFFPIKEINSFNLSNIRWQYDERYEIFYQPIVANLEDNLLPVASGLHHNDVIPTEDKYMSPTTDRLAVYLWLTLINHRLSSYVAKVFAHDLHSNTRVK